HFSKSARLLAGILNQRPASRHQFPTTQIMTSTSKLDSATAIALAETTDGLEAQPILDLERFLFDFADALNTTLELDTLLERVANLVRRVLPFEYFAILLVNEKAQDLRIRFQIGHSAETKRVRPKASDRVHGPALQLRKP